MYESEKQSLIDCALQMKAEQLIKGNGGNVSLRVDEDRFLVTPSAMDYETMVPSDVVVVDAAGNVVEGTRRPTSDITAVLYVFNHRPDINAVIHTHQPYATGLGLVMDEIPCNLSTLANATEGPVNVAAYGDPGNLAMGVEAVKAIGDRLAVVLKHHGVIAVGRDLRQALFACVYLEEACKTIQVALSTGLPMATMTQEQIDEAVAVFHRYGQVTLNERDAAEAAKNN